MAETAIRRAGKRERGKFKRWLLKLYLDITNIYNHANVEVNQPNFDFTRRTALTGLPIIPSFGIRGEF